MLSVIVNVAGAIALLLWAVLLIRTGVERAFSGPMRIGLRHAAGSPPTAVGAGILAALTMQSSTAVAMIIAGFATSGSLVLATGLAIVLGADFGSALAARILLLPIDALVSFLLVVGVGFYLKGNSARLKQLGRIVIGLSLVLVSLSMMRAATQPLQNNEVFEVLISHLANDLLAAFLLGAIMAWATHSSVATILVIVTFASQGLLSGPTSWSMVLGANLGGALIPVWLTLKSELAPRRIMLANLVLRGGGAILAFLAIVTVADVSFLGATVANQAINLHLAFNFAIILVTLPLIKPALRLAAILLPNEKNSQRARMSALDPSALSDPERALSCVTREVLGMGELVQHMLAPSLGLLREWDEETANHIVDMEAEVDDIHLNVKMYVARIQEGELTEGQAQRAVDIAAIANHFEDAGDQIASNMVAMAKRLNAEGLAFSKAGWRELTEFHDRVMSNTQLGLNVLVTSDPEAAIQLVEEKDRTREAEQRLQARHLNRLRKGNVASVETSNLHQETIRALKQVNTAFTYAAYPIAKESGALLSTRLASS